ncbi:hypothetical protein [uncultured Fenollaria sp.]|uniref:hypothetical protein n=1 Tax=uncultured Fenollaria sp. TaxID=1686315 RepID=UPI0025D49D2A|nr:hypothetical protein [uncultured Fenollaria sp.]
MEIVERPWFKASKFLGLYFGISFTLIGLFIYIYWKNIALLINGFVWLFISIAFLCKALLEYYKLKELKDSGVKYKCKINRVIPLNYIRFGSFIVSKVECTYENNGIRYKILDGPYLLSPFEKLEKLSAFAYIGKNKSMLVLSRI